MLLSKMGGGTFSSKFIKSGWFMDIERRLKRDLFSYCVVDALYFDSISNYVPNPERSYYSLAKQGLNSDWQLERMGIWYRGIPLEPAPIPEQGFKIHLSATSKTACQIMTRIMPILNEFRVPFKLLMDPLLLDYMNSKNCNRSSSGKFFTIYPSTTEEFVRLAECLHTATSDLAGPYILSDKPIHDSRVVFFRYGSFQNRFSMNVYGEREFFICDPNGKEVPDDRSPFFKLPSWVQNPFDPPTVPNSSSGDTGKAGEAPTKPAAVLIDNRFKFERSILHSNCGGVYFGKDLETDATVIIKEARPLVNTSQWSTVDAVQTLEKEYTILQRLESTGITPKPLGLFKEWEHSFLVEEFLTGDLLASYRANEDIGLLVNKSDDPDKIRKFCKDLLTIGQNLIVAVESFHKAGVIIGDLAPNNIFVNVDTLQIQIIDFEGAFLVENIGKDFVSSAITAGYVSKNRLEGKPPSFEDDYYSVGSVLYSMLFPVQGAFDLCPAAKYLFIDEISKDTGLPPLIKEGILALLEGRIAEGKTIFSQPEQLANYDLTPRSPVQLDRSSEELIGICDRITSHLQATATPKRTDRLWASDYRVFTTNPMNLSFGAMGILMYLKETKAELTGPILDWILSQPLDNATYAPGMFVGLSGIGMGFSELGLTEKARQAFDLAYQSPLLFDSPDFFFGAAGWGWASLTQFARTQDDYYLEKAREAGDFLRSIAIREGEFCIWPSSDGVLYHSLPHGGSGIALFLLLLHHYTDRQDYLDDALAGMEFEISKAIQKDDYIVWHRTPDLPILCPYWRYGNAGIGGALIRFAAILGQSRYEVLADKAARYALTKYSVFPGQFVGLAGIGEFMLDMHAFTGRESYLKDAQQLTNLMLFSVEQPTGLVFPGEELIRLSCDYGTGSAGIGCFINRLQRTGGRLFYDFDPDIYSRNSATRMALQPSN